ILPAEAVALSQLNLAGLPAEDAERELSRVLADAKDRPFTLETPPLRAMLIALSPERHLFAVAVHHLVSDGWSGDILLHDFFELYRAARAGDQPQLPPLPIRYVDYAAWQQERIAG